MDNARVGQATEAGLFGDYLPAAVAGRVPAPPGHLGHRARLRRRRLVDGGLLASSVGADAVQLSRFLGFRGGHVPGADWAVPTRSAALAPFGAEDGRRPVVPAAGEEAPARLAVPEVRGPTAAPVWLLEDGMAAWRAAGLPLRADRRTPAGPECVDVHLRPCDRDEGVEAAMRNHLSREVDLVRDGDARFGGVRA